MSNYLLLTALDKTNLTAMNAAQIGTHRQITPVQTTDGRWVVNADLLTDVTATSNTVTTEVQPTWGAYESWLDGLTPITLQASDFPAPTFLDS